MFKTNFCGYVKYCLRLWSNFKNIIMKTLQLEDSKARELYKTASLEFKELLEANWGKDFFSQKITDRIKTFEDAYNEVGHHDNVDILLKYNGIDKDMLGAQAMAKLSIIARVLNEGWEPDWADSSQYKYYPYFSNYKSGVGFSRSDCGGWAAATYCGSRLCFKSSELATYAGKQFIDIYNQFLTTK